MNALAAVMQLLVAAVFLSIPLIRHRYGPAAKTAAVAELRRQNVRPEVLEENKLRFDAGGHETAAPVAVAAVMTALAAVNFAGADLAQLLTWLFSSLVMLMNAVIVYSNLTAVRSVEAAFRRKGDLELARVEVKPFLQAAEDAFPRWVRAQTYLRNTVIFGGSSVALIAVSLI
ncbi:conserved membrane protein of unknown function [Streptomyces ambofaciens ATCC 23877]|uniref:Uncharacterized protein n=2 Tax=Streptomyces ambofaciens TaxID=1889 RepID=A0AC03_STRA7|nr:hypothetical protein [Streptomyces ambofaciens]AKZ60356.1 conserved membrane protein of unknown function [Streptomyces ambofaciens ATCC 23877]ANB10559.1 hypothetical protein SAM40697_6606 [Streptomyces ambofaciens]CAJ88007.1 hypothetical protein SAMR0297 [Streptomyces ambofaciens ATCC 23877]